MWARSLALSRAAWQFAGVALVALMGAAASYLAGRRATSGSIRTSEAADLWKESSAIRQEMREERKEIREELRLALKRISRLEDQVRRLGGVPDE